MIIIWKMLQVYHPFPTDWLSGFLDVLGGAYAACALFSIGLFMVGKLTKITGTVLLVATLLIVAKTYVFMYSLDANKLYTFIYSI